MQHLFDIPCYIYMFHQITDAHLKNELLITVVTQSVHINFLPGFDLHFIIDARYTDIDDKG